MKGLLADTSTKVTYESDTSAWEPSNRAQSETIGVVVLVGVFAVVASIVGVVIVGNVTDEVSEAPLVELNATATADNVTLLHAGGDTMDVDDVDVVLQRDDTERYALSSFIEISGDSDDQFEPAERRRHSHPFSDGQLRVLVVHVPSNEVVFEETVETR